MAEPRALQITVLYHFCRLRLPAIALSAAAFEQHLRRGYALFQARQAREGGQTIAATVTREDESSASLDWEGFLENFHVLDWFLASACLEGQPGAWEGLFAA